jgi:hypothetical protein
MLDIKRRRLYNVKRRQSHKSREDKMNGKMSKHIQIRVSVPEKEWSMYKLLAVQNGKSPNESLVEHINERVAKLIELINKAEEKI